MTLIKEFVSGDFVRIKSYLGEHKDHFIKGCEAVVLYSYGDAFGGIDHDEYAVMFPNGDRHAWYNYNDLELIESGRQDLIRQWRNR